MSYSYSDAGGGQSPPEGMGRLVVILPHWAATVNVYNYALKEAAVGPSAPDPLDRERCLVAVNLPPGVYEVEARLEGRCERLDAIVRPGRTLTIRQEDWKSLWIPSPAPLARTSTSRGSHAAAAEELSRKPTWASAPGGASGLFVFVRTLTPKKFPRFAEGLRLLNADGEPLVELTGDAVVADAGQGWMAFNANLPPGYYVLRRGRSGVRPRCQPVYLCAGWQTQVFIASRWTPSLGTMAVNMARPGRAFHADDESALAAEAVLEATRRSAGGCLILDNEKIHDLVRRADENPWLAIVSAYALLAGHRPGREAGERAAKWDETASIVMGLLNAVANHPDVRALSLDYEKPAPAPFTHPPMLRAGTDRVQLHATRFASTVLPDSLTDCVLDDLVRNSQWTAWRQLERMPDFGRWEESPRRLSAESDVHVLSDRPAATWDEARLARRAPRRGRAYTQALLRATAPSLPVFRLEQSSAEFEETGNPKAQAGGGYAAPATVATVLSTPLFQFLETLLSQGDMEDDAVKLDFSGGLAELFGGFTPREVSSASGLPLSRVREAYDRLTQKCKGAGASPDWTIYEAAKLDPAEQAVYEYAVLRHARLGRAARQTTEAGAGDAPAEHSPPVTIEECVSTLSQEADRLSAARGPFADAAGELARRLRRLARELQRRADFLVITDLRGRMTYGNGAFVKLLTDSDEKDELRPALLREWESALAAARDGRGGLPPVSPSDYGPWQLHRIAVADESTGVIQAYAYVLRAAEYPRLARKALREVKQLLPELSLNASLLALGDPERKSDYLEKLEALVAGLERVRLDGSPKRPRTAAPPAGAAPQKGVIMSENTPPNNTDVDESELNADDGTLFEREFFTIKRHELIAGTAEAYLSAKAQEQVGRILAPLGGVGLADIAGWADTVKRRKPRADDDEDTVAFLKDERNRSNDTWHYVDLPLDATGYSREDYPELTRDDDVVQTLSECVRVLKGDSDRFTELSALRLVTHLVGDVFQPVHVGCCYIQGSGASARLVRDPAVVVEKKLDGDHGGNRLILPVGVNGVSLHSYWDGRLGGSNPDISSDPVDGAESDLDSLGLRRMAIEKLHALIEQDAPAAGDESDAAADSTRPEEWAAQWATDSLEAARSAYESLVIKGVNAQDDGNFDVDWEGRQAYDQRCKPIVIERMKLAARNLATLLNTIWK